MYVLQMSSAAQLSLLSETKENPYLPTLFIALVGKPFSKEDFEALWKKRDMESRHPRFHQRVKPSKSNEKKTGSSGVFVPTEVPLGSHVKEKPFPQIFNLDLQSRLQSYLTVPLQVENMLWQAEISTGGSVGQSGAIPKDRAMELIFEFESRGEPEPTESLLLFRGHNALADGVSLAAAFNDLCDEAEEIKEDMRREVSEEKKRKRKRSWWQKFMRLLRVLYYYSIGALQAFWHHWRLYSSTDENPFQQMEHLEDTTTDGKRTLSWATVSTVDEVKQVAKSLTKDDEDVTISDVIVSCVSAAVSRQMQEHQMTYEMDEDKSRYVKIPQSMNVIVPVHSEEGMLKKGQTVGHRIGAFCASVPSDSTYTAAQRLELVHKALYNVQQTPAVELSRIGTKIVSWLPTSWATSFIEKAQPNAAFIVTNSLGPSRRIHFGGRDVEISQAFMPLPPGVPIGITISTYAGKLNISVTAEPWAVPDAQKFLTWVLDEYKFLYTESPFALEGP